MSDKNRAIYAGSFDPITNGHLDIIARAERIFDEVNICVIQNPEKKSFFTIDERIQLINDLFKDKPNITVEGYNGLLVNYAKNNNIYIIIRGLRAVSDFEFEFQISLMNRNLEPKIITVFLMTDEKYSYLSSGLIKQLAKLKADISEFVPGNVENSLKDKLL